MLVKPKFGVSKGMANVPLVKTNIGRTEVVELLAESPEEVEVAVDEELTLTVTEGTLELEVTRLVVERPPETVRPSRVPSTRQMGSSERKRGVQSTWNTVSSHQSTRFFQCAEIFRDISKFAL